MRSYGRANDRAEAKRWIEAPRERTERREGTARGLVRSQGRGARYVTCHADAVSRTAIARRPSTHHRRGPEGCGGGGGDRRAGGGPEHLGGVRGLIRRGGSAGPASPTLAGARRAEDGAAAALLRLGETPRPLVPDPGGPPMKATFAPQTRSGTPARRRRTDSCGARSLPSSSRAGSNPLSARTASIFSTGGGVVSGPRASAPMPSPGREPRLEGSRPLRTHALEVRASIRASVRYRRAGNETSSVAPDRRYSLAGRPAPGPRRPESRRYATSRRPASASLSRWNAARARLTPTAFAASSRPTSRPCAAT